MKESVVWNLLIIHSRIISVINEMHKERVLFSDEWKSETEGSSSRIGREILLFRKNEDNSHFEVSISAEGAVVEIFPNVTCPAHATKDCRICARGA